MVSGKSRNWATIVYVESAPVGWKKTLELMAMDCFISPLHDKDVDENGKLKKPHYHVQTRYNGPVDKKRASGDFSFIGGVGCECVRNRVSYARYLCHLDNPDKYQYSPDDVICIGGSDYIATITSGKENICKIQHEMELFIRERKMYSYAMFSDYCADNNWQWYIVLQKRGNAIMRYIKSIVWTIGEKETRSAVFQNINCPEWIEMKKDEFRSLGRDEEIPEEMEQ